MSELFNRKKVINSITVNMLYQLSGVSPAIVFRIINDKKFLQDLASLIQKHQKRHRRKSVSENEKLTKITTTKKK